jgi:OOP family OmpA-OmpF porin
MNTLCLKSLARNKSMLALLLSFAATCLILGAPASAASSTYKEAKGAKDYPLLGRFDGALLYKHGLINFEKVELKRPDGKVDVMEGKVYNYFYFGPQGRSDLEVYRSYKQSLEKQGFKVLVGCEDGDACSRQGWSEHARKWTGDARTFANGSHYMNNLGSGRPLRFLFARLARPSGDISALITIRDGYMKDEGFGTDYFVQVIEAGAMQQGLVTVKAEALGKSLAADGRIALYGILFDTAKADIKPESKPQLEEMAKTLNQNPAMKVFIVGHTDNQGSLDANTALSQQRANAIVAALVKEHKIAAARLAAKGVASYAPVASNASEQGRGQNRRVEMVVQ